MFPSLQGTYSDNNTCQKGTLLLNATTFFTSVADSHCTFTACHHLIVNVIFKFHE